MIHLGDITKINGAKIEPVDCITAGRTEYDKYREKIRPHDPHKDWFETEPQTDDLFTDKYGDVWEWRGDAWYCISGEDEPQTERSG